MRVIEDLLPGRDAGRIVVIMLPGAKDRPEDLIEHGMVRALRARSSPVDALVVDAPMDCYLDSTIAERLREELIVPTRKRGCARIWLAGISLGGLGALACARECPELIEGMVLLAPFIGVRGLLAKVLRAGGLDRWDASGLEPCLDDGGLLAWFKTYRPGAPGATKIFLGYGRQDRYAQASQILAQRLPAERVLALDGGHDWSTWLGLWERLLDAGLFASAPGLS